MMDMMKVLREAKQMQAKVQQAQDEIANSTFEGSSGGGAVKASVSGLGSLKSIEISAEVVDPEDVEMLQDLVVAAVRGAQDAADAGKAEAMGEFSSILEGMGLPGMPEL